MFSVRMDNKREASEFVRQRAIARPTSGDRMSRYAAIPHLFGPFRWVIAYSGIPKARPVVIPAVQWSVGAEVYMAFNRHLLARSLLLQIKFPLLVCLNGGAIRQAPRCGLFVISREIFRGRQIFLHCTQSPNSHHIPRCRPQSIFAATTCNSRSVTGSSPLSTRGKCSNAS